MFACKFTLAMTAYLQRCIIAWRLAARQGISPLGDRSMIDWLGIVVLPRSKGIHDRYKS
jgi:hypothetical protein